MKEFLNFLKERILLYDGSKGVLLQQKGLKGEEASESWNIAKPDEVKKIYQEYIEAGSDVIQTNTFPGNRVTLEQHGLGDKIYQLNFEGVKLAKEIVGDTHYVAASVGPTGLLFEPAGDLTFDKAYDIYKEQLKAIEDAGADLVNFETFLDLNELRAALLAARETTALPIIASLTFNANSRTLSGNSAEVCAIVCQSLGAAIVGANCSGGPESLIEPIKKMSSVATVPLCVKPNAGMPKIVEGKAVYLQKPEQFASYTKEFIANGVRLIGGCCGTTPDHIRALQQELAEIQPLELKAKTNFNLASAYSHINLAADKDCSVKRIMFKDYYPADGSTDVDVDQLIRDSREEQVDFLLIDFEGGEQFDVWEFVSNFSLAIKTPVIIKSGSAEIVSSFLRYYPGRAGVVLADNLKLTPAQLKHYGALPVNDQLEPLP